jgi:transposase
MSVQLAQQAQESLGTSDLVMIPEGVDDVALLMGQRVKRGLPEVLDRHSPRHWTQRGRSWGWTAVIGLASIVTEGDHRNVSVETSRKGMHHTLSRLPAQGIAPLDCRADRWSHRRNHLRTPAYGHAIERDLTACSMAVYDLSQDVLRCEATTVSGEHAVTAGGRLPCGQRKDAPTRPQLKGMLGSLAPWGMPLATAVVSGERADDGFDIPIMERVRLGLPPPGLLLVGDGTMSALDTRASLGSPQDLSVSPVPLTGPTAAAMDAWGTTGGTQGEMGA